MSDEATSKTEAVLKYRNSALRSLQKELSEIEKSLPDKESDENSNGEKPEEEKVSRWQRAYQPQADDSTTFSKWQLETENSGINAQTAYDDDADGFRGDSKSDNESDDATPLSSRLSRTSNWRDNDSLSLSFSMNTGDFSSLTEAERLEKQLEMLEKRIEETKERLERKGRTTKQREADRLGLKRMKAKLEKLEMRVQNEISGKKRWNLVRKEIRKPAFGLNTFNSVDFLQRKRALSEANGNAPRGRAPRLTTIVEQAVAKNIEEKLMQKRALLRGIQPKIEKEEDAWVKLNLYGAKTLDPVMEEEFAAQMKDEREFRQGWLRISDVREDFMRSIGFYGGNDTSGVRTSQRHMWQRYADRDKLETDPLERPCSPNKQTKDSMVSSRFAPQSKPLPELHSTPRVKKMVDCKKVLTTSFLPKIPSPESKRRPTTSDIEKVQDDKDERLKRERVRLIPNRKRVAENRARLFMAQMDFAKTHHLSSKSVVEGLAYAIEDCGHTPTNEPEPCSTSREKLFLMGALSKDHLRPPGERNARAKSV